MRKIVFALLLSCLAVVNTLAQQTPEQPAFWGRIEHKGKPWVTNSSNKLKITHGLKNRHLSIWASHGRYYKNEELRWKWQRPDLYGTTEDLFTQTIVIPYLMPMLENAGAIVFTPRERDWQRNEVIVDNDNQPALPCYLEVNMKNKWRRTQLRGFACHAGIYDDGENPFEAGTAMMAEATSSKKNTSEISYQPQIGEEGRYAVYVSYQTLGNSVDDAQYIVWHKGEATEFRVNQRMGGGTWVYLGTFDFDKGCNEFNRVVLTNHSKRKGVVTADAVRFGGGMGNIQRGGMTSGLPRTLEGARYYAQWAGVPYKYYSTKNGLNDYGDDINVRSLMTNWLAGGSVYVPTKEGLNVPIELSLAIHSDAGVDRTGIVGSLAISTTDFNDGKLNSGISRRVSTDLASQLLDGVTRDLKYKYQRWNKRYLWDRNYSETRLPEMPSAILETLSHENFNDMRYGHDPNFKFTLARSIYKTILRYVNGMHGDDYVVQPLAPDHFRIELDDNKARLEWESVADPQEKTAKATSYKVYTAVGDGGFDNGKVVKKNNYQVKLEPGVLYSFRVTAANQGGESFPTEVLSAVYQPEARSTVLIVNGFHRLSSPQPVQNDTLRGFDMTADPGVYRGRMAGWGGTYTGMFVAGNDFNYVRTHASAILSARKYNIVSCSSEAVEDRRVDMGDYDCVDMVLGLEKDDRHSLKPYKTFTPDMQKQLTRYMERRGRLMVSGAYVGSDMRKEQEQAFLSNVLHTSYVSSNDADSLSNVSGMGQEFNIYRLPNEQHYAAFHPDILIPTGQAFSVMTYGDGTSACVASDENGRRTLVMGFPFECITEAEKREIIMRGIMNFLIK